MASLLVTHVARFLFKNLGVFCSGFLLSEAEQRWKSLFGDSGVAYAPPGTGWAAWPLAPRSCRVLEKI